MSDNLNFGDDVDPTDNLILCIPDHHAEVAEHCEYSGIRGRGMILVAGDIIMDAICDTDLGHRVLIVGDDREEGKRLLEALQNQNSCLLRSYVDDCHFADFKRVHPKHEHHVPRPSYKHRLRKKRSH